MSKRNYVVTYMNRNGEEEVLEVSAYSKEQVKYYLLDYVPQNYILSIEDAGRCEEQVLCQRVAEWRY